jgi:hypothetical protein
MDARNLRGYRQPVDLSTPRCPTGLPFELRVPTRNSSRVRALSPGSVGRNALAHPLAIEAVA